MSIWDEYHDTNIAIMECTLCADQTHHEVVTVYDASRDGEVASETATCDHCGYVSDR